jgi:hypothetical protein
MKEILKPLIDLSKTGIVVECGDGIIRHIYPVLNILAADYEEA